MSSDTRTIILDAAKRRFAHYGYSKTSMGEIAKDCDMSVGNLYRFFRNKEAIAIAGVEICFREKAETSEGAVDRSASTKQQLEAYLLARLRYMHRLVCETPHMYEMVELVSTRHKDLLERYEERSIHCLTDIIAAGQQRDEVRRDDDAAGMAADLYRATTYFNMPLCMYGPLQEREGQLRSLLATFFTGLKSRGR